MKTRPGDQVLPTVNEGPCVQDLVIADIENRKALGIERYGTVLQPNNGRDTLQDIYDELLDAACYIRQLMEERKPGTFMEQRDWRFPLTSDEDCCGEGCCGD